MKSIAKSASMAALAVVFVVSGCGGASSDFAQGGRAPAPGIAPGGGGGGGDLGVVLPPGSGEFVPNQVLVKFDSSVTGEGRQKAFEAVGGRALEHIATKAMERAGEPGVYLVQTGAATEQAVAQLRGRPGVVLVEPNYVYRHQSSNDPYYTNGSLWGMYGDTSTVKNAFGSQAAEAWALGKTGSSSVVVGIIDEGVMVTHADLSANIWVNPFDPVDGVDNDGNGYIDDTNGWDFASNDRTVFDGSADDHGTHVAGTIGARGNNALGVAGVVWNVKMISAKFLGNRGGTTANAIRAFDYLTDLKTRHGLDIVASNNSWGGGGFSQLLKDAIDRHGAANILAIVAAGNSGVNIDASPSYPASYTSANIISVASITSTGARSSFSNYGATSVDIGAPGSAIWSTVPSRNGGSSYASYNGTSMATPHVAGGAALRASTSASRGLALKADILNAGVPTASMSATTSTGDRLNVSGF